MSMDEQQAFLYDVGGRQTAVAHGARERFEQEHPDAFRLQLFNVGGSPQVVAQANAEEYRKENPGAQPVYLFNVDGKPKAVAQRALGGFLEEARAREQERVTGPAQPKKSVARDLLDVAASRAGAAGMGVATAPGELLGGVAAAVGGVDRSTPQGRAVREHQERGDTWDPVMKMWHPAEAVMTEDKRNWAQRQWDKVRGGVVRANQNFNDALVELGHGLRDWREGTKAAPTTVAGEVAAPVADTAATLGKYALLAPTGLGGAVMGAEGASESLARTEGRSDLSAADKLALAAAGGAANAAIYGAAGARATAPISNAIASRAGASAASKVVSGGGARMAADALKMGAASVAGDVAAAEPVDWGRAAKAAQEGAIIGFASGAASSVPRALEASARETARRMQDPATQLRRMAEAVPPDLAEAGENVAAAAVPESPMDAYARRKAAEANPASDFAGEAGREFLARGARDLERREADAARLAEEELATREAPQVAPEEVPPTVAPEARPGNAGNAGSEAPASGGASRPGEPQSPAPAPVAESATAPRRVTGRPRELSTMHENGNSTTLATVKNRAEKGVLPVEIVVRPNGMGVSRAGQFDANEPVVLFRYESDGADSLGHPVFGNTERILAWAKEPGLADKASVSTVEPSTVAKAATPPRERLPEEVAHDKAEAARQEAVAALAAARETGDVMAVRDATKAVQSAARKEDNARRKMETALANAGRGSVRADVAAETPRLAGTARPTEGRETPFDGLKQELTVMMDAGATGAELDAFAQRAEAAGAFATAARARQAAGTYQGTPWSTDGGNWPHAEPPAARASFGDLFALAKNLGDGKAPEFLRRISRLPWAEGVFRFREGDPKSGSIQQRSGLLRLVSDSQMEALRAEAQAEAESRGFGPERTAEEAQRIFSKKLRDTIRENAFAGPKEAMAVLAHEIGHWVDFLDEGTLKRGNVLGHIAALKRYMAKTLYETKGLADEAGWPGMTKEERAEIVKEAEKSVDPLDFEDNPAGYRAAKREARQLALEEAYTEMRLRAYPDVRREAQNLIAWYRQSDGMPDYFRNPSEMFAEAFSAWVNYPAEAAKRAPAFADLLENWLDARPEAARALREFRDGVTQAEARAAKAAGDVTNPAFFAALDQGSAAARRAEELAGRLTDEALAGRRTEDFWAKTKLALSGPDDILKGELMRSSLGAFNSHNLPLWRAMQQKDNANNRMVLWDYRFRTHVEPILHGVPRATFLNYLYHFRVAHELLGPDATRGRMNLPNAEGLTPGDVSRAEGNAQTSSAAWLNELRRTHPEIAEKCERARREFWNKVRNGGDELGGEGSPMDVIRNSPCLSAEQKAALLGNEAYVAFRPAVVPDVSRAVSTGEMSVWDGIFSQRTGSEKPVGDVLANTLLQDLTMQDQLLRQEYRLRAVDWLKANKAEWIGPEVPAQFDPATKRQVVPQREKDGWRVVTFLRNGKPEGWWVRDFIADALAPKPHQVSALEGFRGFANKSARGINALKTTLNPAFGVANTLKDAFSIALRQLPRDTSGVGHARALLDGAANWLGDYGAMFRSFGDTSAADIVHGKWNPDAARALAWGALNNAAPNQSAYAGGGEKGGIGEMADRYRELGRSEISDKDLRAALKTFGYSEKQISGALDRTEAPLVRALKEAARVTGLRWAAGKHADVMSFLSRGEIRTKSFALAEAMRRNPGMTREEAVQWVHDMIGTPAMNNRPTVAKLPGIGHVVPFLTPRVHGWTDQLYGALRSGWTGGPGQSAMVASRLAFATTMMAIPLAAVSILRGEAEEAEKKGDKERADALRGMARRWQAIPSTDILTGICFPNPLGKNSHIKIPVDPTIVPLAGLALEKIFGGGGKNLAPGAGMEQFTGDLMPTLGTVPTMALALTNGGVDPNTGRRVVGERTPGLDRLTWSWDQLTARGLGMLPGSMLRAWMVGNEDAREMERASRADKWTPVVSAFWRPFLRRSGYGLVERGNVMRDLNSAAGKRAQEIAERIAAGRPVSKADEDWFYENVTDPRSMVNSASGRLDALKTKTPDQRAAEALPAIRADAIEKAAGYIRPPRLTDEDRAR